MKMLLPCVLSLLVLTGCFGGGADNETVKLPEGAGQPLNPTGKVSPQQAEVANARAADAKKAQAGRAAALNALRGNGS